MDIREIYSLLNEKIKSINFNKLWEGFYPFDFALYDKDMVYLKDHEIIKDSRFIGNTAIVYNDNYLAIWNAEGIERMDINVLASKMIHEMFHAYQYAKLEKRFPDEINAIFNYSYEPLNLSIKYEEHKLLVELIDNFDNDLFLRLIQYKLLRKNTSQNSKYESQIEVVEGMAQYVEMLVLRELDYDLYVKYLNNIKNRLLDKNKLFPIRHICYDSGAITMLICHNNNIDIKHDIGEETRTIDDLLTCKYYMSEELVVNEDEDIVFMTEEYMLETKKLIERKIQNVSPIQVNYRLTGFDPFNARRYYDFIYCPHFVGIIEDGNFVPFIGDYVIFVEDGWIKEMYKVSFND